MSRKQGAQLLHNARLNSSRKQTKKSEKQGAGESIGFPQSTGPPRLKPLPPVARDQKHQAQYHNGIIKSGTKCTAYGIRAVRALRQRFTSARQPGRLRELHPSLLLPAAETIMIVDDPAMK